MVVGETGLPLESALSLAEWEVCGGLRESATTQGHRMEGSLAEGTTSSMSLATPTVAQVRVENVNDFTLCIFSLLTCIVIIAQFSAEIDIHVRMYFY